MRPSNDHLPAPATRRLVFRQATPFFGRRPEGFTLQPATTPGTGVGAWCAQAARMKGASIAAFLRLGEELRLHRAPGELVSRAYAAAIDEARHFKLMRDEAVRFGAGEVACPRPARRRARPLAEVARENVVEGCVVQSFAAIATAWQARAATDAGLSATLAEIAEDESRHAQLAWDVHAWITQQALPAEVRSLEAERADAGLELLTALAAPVDETLTAVAGVPAARAATSLAATAFNELWADREEDPLGAAVA